MKLTERHWWAILMDAEAVASDTAVTTLAAHNVGNRARYALVKEFGLNLDTVWDDARPEFMKMLEEEEAKIKAEEESREKLRELLAKAEVTNKEKT